MTTEQQRLHEQHKARLARIQNNAVRAPEPVKPVVTSGDKFNRMGAGFPRVGNRGAIVGRETAAPDASRAAPVVQDGNAAPTPSAAKRPSPASWLHIAGSHLTVRDIQDAVIAHFRMSRVELFAKRRSKATVRRRHIAIYLSKILTIQSLPEIGMRFGGLDHTTILYASRKIERELPKDAELARDVAEIERTLAALNEVRANAAQANKANA
ncbi:helix-turn-helix domain-containing protein [Bradyrhizobium sp. SYSU BS000235]|uniref:helix-turn-helix domain-containing protein n=1 Tax=Bradyrhizobium sp. SYSU BS000235 TaxID=3411332 RepID=UPI003C72238E